MKVRMGLTRLMLAALPLYCDARNEEMRGGYIEENPVQYRTFQVRPAYRDVLPPSTDLSTLFPPPGRQGVQSSCVGWALGYAARSYYARKSSRGPESDSWPFSPSFVYNLTKEGECNSGSSISSGLDLLKRVGILSLSEFPYDPKDCSRKPSQLELHRAELFRIKDWARVDTQSPEALKAEIFQGNPVIFGMKISPDFYRLKTGIYGKTENAPTGGHAMVIVGYDDHRKAFKVLNSWGPNWGEGGFGWIAYGAMMDSIQNAFVMIPEKVQDNSLFTPTLPTEKTPSVKSQISILERSVGCASLREVERVAEQPRIVGTVGDRASKELLAGSLAQTFPAYAVSLDIHPWPQCEALQALNPLLSYDKEFVIRANGESEISLEDGDPLIISIQRPLNKPYLAVYYLQADGRLIRLNAVDYPISNWVPRDVVLGIAPKTLFVSEPFGEEMIIAFASDQPLPNIMSTGDLNEGGQLLSQLRDWLDVGGQDRFDPRSQMSASYALLHTRASRK